MQDASRAIKDEPDPAPEDIWKHVFATENVSAEGVEPSAHPRTEEG